MTQAIPLPSHLSTNGQHESNASGVSWSAVIAGAVGTAALSLILLALGAGFGLSSVSPWSNVGASASTMRTSAVVWFIVLEVLSSSLGGYLAGRLRTRWSTIHTDEVYFRDTAHGFLAWCTALVITAAFLASSAAMMTGASASSKSGGAGNQLAEASNPNAYFVDKLFRGADATTSAVRAETEIIFANGLRQGSLSPADKTYLDQLVSTKGGVSPGEADDRVTTQFGDAQQAAEIARKTIAHSLLWMFVGLLIGAFSASLSATIGGSQRDHVVNI